ncbi:UBP-type zinc finger domain-containing protein [Burkholderia cenocepacia]|uniref:UBP-type zinc finger domain-containing protein n=1 Tax=Burkholderia cenocepacia TaxID=95486 RepID=UPI0006682C23|nr:UBP-type zinc finger domain-containing protein [Burkholderia cenocepacia]MCO8322547.1 UBP-type zinc finger domain-containing protein [Burkholderia cenocepacia]MCO8329832.1 UBP-type zinc finger domain-containing protein [Burkholderia cenocepacia]MCO8337117.1 UBP-type zinc finger domain-containing protein [Burkholderia cenocepacia]MCO8344402.1 UBP-type zinc finger domain-containing protein [Burkholderia cenocepacia]MCO8357685.1 UBP-type zinc finger domain-containing protein [Burkholderia ceno
MANACTHLDEARVFDANKDYCDECIRSGSRWVHLRMCLICGHVGCCDSSPNRHASRHFRDTGHRLVRSIEPGERWIWCYADEVVAGEVPS